MIETATIHLCEKALADHVADVASELRLVAVGDLIAYVRAERYGEIEDLVNCAAELYFRPAALRYGWAAAVDLDWLAPPAVALNMEFTFKGATAFFVLRLDGECGGVDLLHLAFDDPARRRKPAASLFRALASARIRPVHG